MKYAASSKKPLSLAKYQNYTCRTFVETIQRVSYKLNWQSTHMRVTEFILDLSVCHTKMQQEAVLGFFLRIGANLLTQVHRI